MLAMGVSMIELLSLMWKWVDRVLCVAQITMKVRGKICRVDGRGSHAQDDTTSKRSVPLPPSTDIKLIWPREPSLAT
jgi:hypothetical protein